MAQSVLGPSLLTSAFTACGANPAWLRSLAPTAGATEAGSHELEISVGGLSGDGLHAGDRFRSDGSRRPGRIPPNSGRPARGAFIVDFANGHNHETHLLTNWDIDASWLGVSYRASNIAYGQHGLSLMSRREPSPVSSHTSAEFQYVGAYGYGRYEAVLRASDAPGVVTAFFVYTGADRGEPHDEIDVEIVGRAPGNLHTNFFRDGKGSPIDIALGFNTAKGHHLYAFEWLPDSISWSVDGVPIRRVTSDQAPIPTTTGRVMASLWAANRSSVEWVGTPTFETATANVRCISHVPAGETGRQCSDTFVPLAGP